MRFSRFILYWILSMPACIPALSSAQTGTVKGKVFNAATNDPIPFANIIVYGDPTKGTTSDIDGNFVLGEVRPGYMKLVATFVGFEKTITEDFLVTRAHPAVINIRMNEVSVKLKEVEIRASAFLRKIESPVSLQTLSTQEIEKNPGANRDISRVIQVLPGVLSTPAYRNDIIVRGGGPSENRFYLDGIEIPNLNHFATQGASGGPVGILNADFIREVDFFAGAFPANRNNALSSVVEFRQIDGSQDEWNFRSALGATDLAITADGPVSRNSNLLASVRRSYLQFLFDVLGLPFLPVYNDYQVRYKWNIDPKNQLTLISIGALDVSTLNTGIKNPDESQRYILGYLPENKQWTYTIGGVYRHFRSNGSDLLVLSRNMLDNRAVKYAGNIVADGNKTLDYESREIENKIRAESTRKWNRTQWNYGLNLEYAKYSNDAFQRVFLNGEEAVISKQASLKLWKWGGFVQASRAFLDERLDVSLGLRTDANDYSAKTSDPAGQLSPRVSVSLELSDRWYWNSNAGRYYQQPPYTALGHTDNNGNYLNKANGLRFIRADHLVTGIEYLPGEQSRLTLEGFLKLYGGYPLSAADGVSIASKGADFGVYGDEALFSSSDGRTYGLELLYRTRNLLGWNILASVTYVTSEFTNNTGKYLPSSWDNKILFNTTVTRSLVRNWDVGMKWRYVGGSPYTPYDMELSSVAAAWDARNQGYLDYGRFNSLRLSAFHQLDIRVDKSYYFPGWTLMLYVDIQNVYNFKAEQPGFLVNYDAAGNPVQYTDTFGVDRYRLRLIPDETGTILPTIGIQVVF